jgi:competence protein ComGF
MMRNNRGFTLVEMLVTLSGFLLIVSLLPLLLNIDWMKVNQSERFQRLEWQLFIQQVTSEIREAKEIEVNNQTLYLYKFTGEKVSLEKYGYVIRRRVNGQGHEILLQYISDVQYQLEVNGIRIKVMTEQGTDYEAFITTFFPLKVKIA